MTYYWVFPLSQQQSPEKLSRFQGTGHHANNNGLASRTESSTQETARERKPNTQTACLLPALRAQGDPMPVPQLWEKLQINEQGRDIISLNGFHEYQTNSVKLEWQTLILANPHPIPVRRTLMTLFQTDSDFVIKICFFIFIYPLIFNIYPPKGRVQKEGREGVREGRWEGVSNNKTPIACWRSSHCFAHKENNSELLKEKVGGVMVNQSGIWEYRDYQMCLSGAQYTWMLRAYLASILTCLSFIYPNGSIFVDL